MDAGDAVVEIEKIAFGESGFGLREFLHALPCLHEVHGFHVVLERLTGNSDAFGKHQLGFPQGERVALNGVRLIHHPHIPRRSQTGDRLGRERAQRGEA